MPEIFLDSSLEDIGWVLALMVYPNDESAREHYLATAKARHRVHGLSPNHEIVVSARSLEALVQAPDYREIDLKWGNAFERGCVAGDILLTVYVMNLWGIEEPSLKKAKHVVRRLATGKSRRDGSPVRSSTRYIDESWKRYRAVSHIWAAFRLCDASDESGELKVLGRRRFPFFLSVAVEFWNFGIDFVPHRSQRSGPLLDRDKSWYLPSWMAPIVPEIQFDKARLQELLADYENTYRHQ